MATQRYCDVCKYMRVRANGSPGVRRYVVQRSHAPLPPGSRYTVTRRERFGATVRSYGAGAIDLCDECWEQICAPHMRPGRAPRKGSVPLPSFGQQIAAKGGQIPDRERAIIEKGG